MTLYEESAADQTDHFADAIVPKKVTHGYDIMTFESLQSTPLCLEKFSGYFNVLMAFSVQICLK